ncbi:unnamed protein product [Chrysoparadoxa australica]
MSKKTKPICDDHLIPSWLGQLPELGKERLNRFVRLQKRPSGGKKYENKEAVAPVPPNERVRVEVPMPRMADMAGVVLALILSIPGAITYAGLLIFTLPLLFWCQIYIWCHQKPKRRISRGVLWLPSLAISFILAAPAILLVLFNVILVIVFSHVLALPYGLITMKPICKNWALLSPWRRLGRVAWGDFLTAIIGQLFRQGFFEFWLKLPIAATVVPVIKYCLVSNPCLHKLSEVYVNQWTPPIDIPDAHVFSLLVKSISWSFHTERDRQDIDEDAFAAHYPLPPKLRRDPTVVGLQLRFTLVLFTNTKHNIKDEDVRSETGTHGIFFVPLYYWNPFHMWVKHITP